MPDQVELRPTLGAGVVAYEEDPGYRSPDDPLVAERLEQWRDRKFGVIVHWGLYAALGEDGSWTLCRSRDEGCMQIPAGFGGDDDAWQEHYVASRTTFTGASFDAEEWASAIAGAGARYLVVTTKHHDGFSMFDTALSDFRSTAPDVPFGRDFIAELGGAVRAHGLGLGLYFSKADWHHPGYWSPDRPPVDRFHNHDDQARWDDFAEFTHGQVRELLTSYGDVDLLWLDAGWVKAPREDLDIAAMARTARELQPGILVVDREVHTSVEDYRTPEQRVPEQRLDHPWESCITLSDTWCTTPEPGPWKSVAEVVELLVTIVARGGNLLLGVGPDGDGAMAEEVASRLAGIGDWLGRFGDAIYGTRPVTPGLVTGNAAHEAYVDEAGRSWWLTEAGAVLNLIALGDHAQQDGAVRVPLAQSPVGVRVIGATLDDWSYADGVLTLRWAAADPGPVPTVVVSVTLPEEVAPPS